jgi:hypothetical protein
MFLLLRTLRRALLPYDFYERHHITGHLLKVAGLLGGAESPVLDVGGRARLLAQYIKQPVIAVNPDCTGDLVGSGEGLPFGKRAFRAVVTIDTIEHVPLAQRDSFLQECWRVADQGLLVAAPLGSPAHSAYESYLHELHLATRGVSYPYLAEHVAHGLPTLNEIHGWGVLLGASHVATYFAGDFIKQGRSFARPLLAVHRPPWQAKLFNAYNRWDASVQFQRIQLDSSPQPTTNRFYALFSK